MYTRHFGLKEKPFANTPDQRFLYLSKSHQLALKHLRDGLNRDGGVILLTGKEGVGKTFLCRRFIEEISSDINVALILNSNLSAMDFLAAVCDELGIAYNAKSRTFEEYLAALNSYLLQALPTGKKTAIIIDDAHKLSSEVFVQLQKLTNSKNTPQKLLHVFLIGSPQLLGTLKRPELASLLDDVSAEFRLPPLEKEEVGEYIKHRLRIAGSDSEIFGSDALEVVAKKSQGKPRLINEICDRSLEMAFAKGFDKLTPTVVEQAVAELTDRAMQRKKRRRRSSGTTTRQGCSLRTLLFALLLLGLLGAAAYMNFPALKNMVGRITGIMPSSQQSMPAGPVVPNPGKRQTPRKIGENVGDGESTEPAWLRVKAGEQNHQMALRDLFAEWHIDYDPQAGADPRQVAQAHNLEFIAKQANWPGLLYFNRPAILEVKRANSTPIEVVLVGLLDRNVIIKAGGNEYLLPEKEVQKVWTGRFFMLKEK